MWVGPAKFKRAEMVLNNLVLSEFKTFVSGYDIKINRSEKSAWENCLSLCSSNGLPCRCFMHKGCVSTQ